MTDSILDAWFAGFVADGWAGARLDRVAAAAGVGIGDVADRFPDRWSALRGYQARLDRAALVEAASDPHAPVRERLFALLMARFDAAQPQRAAVKLLAEAARRDPGLALFFAAELPRSLARIAAAAGVDTTGLLGPLRVQALLMVYARVVRAWFADDSPDLSATMRALDEALGQAEQVARLVPARVAAVAESME